MNLRKLLILCASILTGTLTCQMTVAQIGEYDRIVLEDQLTFEPDGGGSGRFFKFSAGLGYLSGSPSPDVYFQDTAPSNALYVGQNGLGIGTALPGAALHLLANNDNTRGYSNARIRIENNKNSRFKRELFEMLNNGPVSMRMYDTSTNRNWAMVGGAGDGQLQFVDTGFVTMAINNHELPQIGGFVGIGTSTPQSKLHVYTRSDSQQAAIQVENDQTETALRTMFELVNNGPSRFELANTSSGETWAFQTNNSDNFMINRLGSGGNEFSIRKNGMVTMGPGGRLNFLLHPNGNLQIAGAISEQSDRNAKEAFQSVDAQSVLDKVCGLPITTWRYKDETGDVRHMGPMAQDFHAAFGLGDSDKSIATVDRSGVTFAAIQALNEKLESELEDKEQRIAELEAQMVQVMAMMQGNQ